MYSITMAANEAKRFFQITVEDWDECSHKVEILKEMAKRALDEAGYEIHEWKEESGDLLDLPNDNNFVLYSTWAHAGRQPMNTRIVVTNGSPILVGNATKIIDPSTGEVIWQLMA